jgi:methyl-accepting chemotaxis protein
MTFLKSVKGKLLLIVMLSLAVLGVSSVTTTWRLAINIGEYDSVINTTLEAQKFALSANLEFKRQVQEWKNTLIRGADAEQMDKYWGRFNQRHDSTQGEINKLIPLLNEWPELEAIALQFLVDHTNMQTAYSTGRDQYIAAGFEVAVGDKAVSGIDRAPSAALDELVDQLAIIAEEQTGTVKAVAQRNITYSYVATAIILLIVTVVTYLFVERIIVSPLYSVRKSLAALANGNLTVSSKYVSEDEIGNIADSARQLQEFLYNNVDTMKQTANALQEASAHMANMSNDLSNQSNDQMHATDQVATAVQELTHSAGEVANNSQQTSDITQLATDKTNESKRTALTAQNRAVDLVADLNKSAEVIKNLADNAANVSSVLDVIRGIAEQTNLLALNAAIEAARAGEQGRGFAVVADEVRTLAQRTQDSTAEIENILDSVKSGADQAVVSMDTGQNRSQEVETEITQAAQLLNEIAEMVEEINAKNVQIATASSEQTDVTNNISELIQNIHSLSEQTHNQVSQTQQVSAKLADLVSQFEQQISRFQL